MALGKISTQGTMAQTLSMFDTRNSTTEATGIGVSFSDYLNQALNNTNELLLASDQIADDFAAGRTDNIGQVALAAEKADVALQLTLQIRNKIMDAYSEIMRMQL